MVCFSRPRALIVSAALAAGGCGPLLLPMVPRPTPEQQQRVDAMWHNMLDPRRNLDRQVLLDVLTNDYLYGYGIDRATFHSEKTVDGTLVQMDVTYDQSRPQRDTFTVTLFDEHGQLLRREAYTRDEVNDSLGPGLITRAAVCTTQPLTADQLAAQKRLEWRIAAASAATRPYGAPADPDFTQTCNSPSTQPATRPASQPAR